MDSTAQTRSIIDKVVAKVGGEIILLSEIEEQFSAVKAERGVLPDSFRCIILDNLLTQKLLLNQAKLDSVTVTDEEVEAQLTARIDRILKLMNGDISQFEAYYGRTISEVKSQFRRDLRDQIMVERLQSQLMTEASVTPSEVKSFFETIPKDSLPFFSSEVEVREIVYYPKANSTERERAITRLEELRRRIVEDGEDFAEIARVHSDDASARAGGDLGWAKRGDYVAEFEATVYNLERDEISEVIESEFGFHVIQLLERRGNSVHARHILVDPEITEPDLAMAYSKLDSVRTLILSDSISFSKAVKRFSTEKVQSYNNDGRMVNPSTGSTVFEISELEPEIYFAIDTLEAGDITTPIGFLDFRGKKGFRIVLLESRTKPHKASLNLDYSKIRQATLEQKQNIFINEWVEGKIASTFVEIDPFFKSCPILRKWNKSDRP